MNRRNFSLVVLFICGSRVSGLECPKHTHKHTDLPYFTTKASTDLLYIRYGHFAELSCCMAGADDIVWTKLNTENGTWDVFHITEIESNRIEFVNNRQGLVFKSVQFQDGGTYKCFPKRAELVHSDISRKFSIDVISCDPLARGPYAIAPVPCEETVTQIGETLALPCNAYFGCDDGSDFRFVQWYVSRDGTDDSDWIPASDFDPRYTVTTTNTGNNVEVHSNLTISRVEKEDLSRRFKCVLASAQIVHGETSIPVKLVASHKHYGKTDDDVVMASVTITTVAGIACVLIIVIGIFIGVTIMQARKTRKHISRDIQQKISLDRLPLHIGDSKTYSDDVV